MQLGMFIDLAQGYGEASEILAGRVPMAADTVTLAKPGHKAIRIAADGSAFIEGYRCDACGAAFPEATLACRACASRTPPHPFRASESIASTAVSTTSDSAPVVLHAATETARGAAHSRRRKGVQRACLKETTSVTSPLSTSASPTRLERTWRSGDRRAGIASGSKVRVLGAPE